MIHAISSKLNEPVLLVDDGTYFFSSISHNSVIVLHKIMIVCYMLISDWDKIVFGYHLRSDQLTPCPMT
jgi:hypothetical protein